MTYLEFTKRFPNETSAINFIVSVKYKNGYVCQKCGCVDRIDHNTTYSLGDGKHTNGIESCWAVLKRSVYGIFHHVSVKHLQQYVDEFCFRLNNRDCDAAFLKCVGLAVA